MHRNNMIISNNGHNILTLLYLNDNLIVITFLTVSKYYNDLNRSIHPCLFGIYNISL